MTMIPQGYTVRRAEWSGPDGDAARAIRMTVFVDEQHCSAANELDAIDERAWHFVAFDFANAPAGTARLFADEAAPETAWIGRMAVLRGHRGTGCGAALMDAALDAARQAGFRRVFLSAQCHAEGFYARWGFVATGDVYDDEGIPHRLMTLEFLNPTNAPR